MSDPKDWRTWEEILAEDLTLCYDACAPLQAQIAAIRTALWDAIARGRPLGGDRSLMGLVAFVAGERDELRRRVEYQDGLIEQLTTERNLALAAAVDKSPTKGGQTNGTEI